ncbi:MAG: ParA family protein [Bacteroidales bacterium]|nr:ParA family protein [Bacteroidales bacterium]
MATVISINNYKGGSGKTATAVNLAYVLSKDSKVLLIDLDPQADASIKFFKDFDLRKGISEVLSGDCTVFEAISHARENLDVLTSKNELNLIADQMQRDSKIAVLKKITNEVKDNYDYILIDNNPKLNIVLVNCIYCADYIVVPVNIDNNAIKGANNIIQTIMDVINNAPVDIDVDIKILMTMVSMSKGDPTNIAKEVIGAMRQAHQENVFKTYIRFQQKLAQKTSFITDYFVSDEENKLSEDYQNLANEIKEISK